MTDISVAFDNAFKSASGLDILPGDCGNFAVKRYWPVLVLLRYILMFDYTGGGGKKFWGFLEMH